MAFKPMRSSVDVAPGFHFRPELWRNQEFSAQQLEVVRWNTLFLMPEGSIMKRLNQDPTMLTEVQNGLSV